MLTGKVVIDAESRLKLNYAKLKTDELGSEDDNSVDVKEDSEKLIELAENNKVFEDMWCDVENKAVFGTFVNICLVHFCSSINWRYTAYNTIVSDIFTESDEAFAMLLLENKVDDYKQLIELKRKLTRKEARQKYLKDPNVNENVKGWLRKGIRRYNSIIKALRLGRNS